MAYLFFILSVVFIYKIHTFHTTNEGFPIVLAALFVYIYIYLTIYVRRCSLPCTISQRIEGINVYSGTFRLYYNIC